MSPLRTIPSGIGTDRFFHLLYGMDFGVWRRNLESEIASNLPAS